MPETFMVTGKYTKGDNNPSAGQISLQPTEASRHAGNGVILATDEIEIDLDSTGSFSIKLYATNDAGWSVPFLWEVRERIIGGPTSSYTFALTADTNLASVAPS
jgi:hypothetical protein